MSEQPDRVLLPVFVMYGNPRQRLEGRLVELQSDRAEVELLEPLKGPLDAGTGVSVYPEGERNMELVGIVSSIEHTRVRVALHRAGHREDRWSPREQGRLHFQYCPTPPGTDVEAWVHGGLSPVQPTWTRPDQRVEISLTGLAFLSSEPVAGPLLVAFRHPVSNSVHRLVANVVRSDPTRRAGIRRVSLQFVSVPEATGQALAETLMGLQDQALEALGAGSTLDLPPMGTSVAEPYDDL